MFSARAGGCQHVFSEKAVPAAFKPGKKFRFSAERWDGKQKSVGRVIWQSDHEANPFPLTCHCY
jgi:hypothetical protein